MWPAQWELRTGRCTVNIRAIGVLVDVFSIWTGEFVDLEQLCGCLLCGAGSNLRNICDSRAFLWWVKSQASPFRLSFPLHCQCLSADCYPSVASLVFLSHCIRVCQPLKDCTFCAHVCVLCVCRLLHRWIRPYCWLCPITADYIYPAPTGTAAEPRRIHLDRAQHIKAVCNISPFSRPFTTFHTWSSASATT